jgi:hypothetical protein
VRGWVGRVARAAILLVVVPLAVVACGARPASIPASAPAPLAPIGLGSGSVSAFPEPGSATASPGTQISFDGATGTELAGLTVTGSVSGHHDGRVEGYSTGTGASFLPARPFVPAERVTVSTGLAIRGGHDGMFAFTIATPATETTPPVTPKPVVPPTPPATVTHNVSARSIHAPVVTVETHRRSAAAGDIFLGTKGGGLPHAVTIVDGNGKLVWYHPEGTLDVEDVHVQQYDGQRVLTWWQGHQNTPHGYGDGVDVIVDSSYRRIATVRAGNGWSADLHDFELTSAGTALITVAAPIRWNLSALGGPVHGIVIDDLIQEIDVKTGLVMFEWGSLDHVPLSASTAGVVKNATTAWDFIHLNSVTPAPDDGLLLSSRHTFALYDVDLRTGNLRWTLGGRDSTFLMSRRARFYYQHDARFLGRWHITLFDDGGGPPRREAQSRALELTLHPKSDTVTVARSLTHRPEPVVSDSQGNVQALPNGDLLVGFGAESHITEFDPAGRVVFEATLPRGVSSYRAYRSRWVGSPATVPVIAVTRTRHGMRAHVSWNGDTRTMRWRLLVGSSTAQLVATSTVVARHGFQATLPIPRGVRVVAVQALGADGRPLARSAVATTR